MPDDPMCPRHLSDPEPRGEEITFPGEWSDDVGWIEDGAAKAPDTDEEDLR